MNLIERISSKLICIVIGIYLVTSIHYMLITPQGEAPDELPHLMYTDFIYSNWELGFMDMKHNGGVLWQSHNPPLYYFTSAVLQTIFFGTDVHYLDKWNTPVRKEFQHTTGAFERPKTVYYHNNDKMIFENKGITSFYFHRFINILYGLIFILILYYFGNFIFNKNKIMASFLAFVPVAIPQFNYLISTINTHGLELIFASLSLFFIIKFYKSLKWKDILLVSLFMGIGVNDRITFHVLVVGIFLFFIAIFIFKRDEIKFKTLLLQFLTFCFIYIAFYIWHPIVLMNYENYDKLFHQAAARPGTLKNWLSIDWWSNIFFAKFFPKISQTFFAMLYHMNSPLSTNFYLVWWIIFLTGFLGLTGNFVYEMIRFKRNKIKPFESVLFAIFVITLFINIVTITTNTTSGQGRYLWISFLPICFIIVNGIRWVIIFSLKIPKLFSSILQNENIKHSILFFIFGLTIFFSFANNIYSLNKLVWYFDDYVLNNEVVGKFYVSKIWRSNYLFDDILDAQDNFGIIPVGETAYIAFKEPKMLKGFFIKLYEKGNCKYNYEIQIAEDYNHWINLDKYNNDDKKSGMQKIIFDKPRLVKEISIKATYSNQRYNHFEISEIGFYKAN